MVAADLPPGRWSALLVGAWWPAQPDAPMAGVTYWREAAQLKRNEANDLRNERSRLAVNQGRTADDLLERYWRGEQRLATIAHQCEIKSDQSEQVADTVNYLRDRLTEIAQSGNQQINQILAGKGPIEAKVAAVNAVIEQSNAMADHVGATAMSNIIDATQRVFDETIGGDAHTWLRDHGVSLDTPPSRPWSLMARQHPRPPPAAAPAGPLPAYGADLRPPVTTPPATPPTPTGPISGAAVTPSSPAAGGSLMSPVVNKSTAPATTQAQPSNPTPPLASATAAATTGAAAGDTSRRAAEQQRLRRILDTVARQEPGLSWAAGLRDNGQTTLLVTDLASGWIPPHIRLPAHITLLEPAPRRRHATVTDLLGTTTVAAAHHPHGYLSQPDPDTPALTGDRTARIAPTIDELGPTLVETVRRHDTLPRIAQAVVVAATRNYGVPDNETDLLHHKTTEIHQAVLTTYPNHDIATVVDWMLLAAINALIAGDQSGANYHLAWAIAAISTRRSR
ncbi:putative transmembrane protein [Mycobacterium tuberculosis]|nr:putative transmembrane protein [Mycobacterium tuberculosis]